MPIICARRLRDGSVLTLTLALWALSHPFTGIRHDGKLYALQALNRLYPDQFAKDLFFSFGSQDQFSIFSALYATTIAALGLIPATWMLQAFGLLAWFAALWTFARALARPRAALAVLLVGLASSQYGSHFVFAYGEAFVTARLYAEALCLIGLAACLRQHWLVGALALAGAALLHPLMALPASLIALALWLRPRTWLVLLPAGAAAVFALAWAGVAPFTGLIAPMDPLWWDAAVARSPFVFVHAWDWNGYSQALYVCLLLALGWRVAPDPTLRRLAGASLVCTVAAFAVSLLGGSILQLPLIAGLQLTRVLWITQITGLILLTIVFWQQRHASFWNRLLVWGLAFTALVDTWAQAPLALLLLATTLLGRARAPDYCPARRIWLLLAGFPLLFVAIWLNYLGTGDWHAAIAPAERWRVAFYNPGSDVLIASAVYLWYANFRHALRWLAPAAVLSGALLAFAALRWHALPAEFDYDDPTRRSVIAPIQRAVPPGALVYWVEEPDKAWFWLRRANYLSFSQSAGMVFARGTAIEAARRARFARAANPVDANLARQAHKRVAVPVPPAVPASAARSACDDPLLDFVIAPRPSGGAAADFRDPATGRAYTLYPCSLLRAQAGLQTAVNTAKSSARAPARHPEP